MLRIQATHNESPESLFRRFKRACAKEGVIAQYKRSCYFEKPSDKKRREKRRMIRKAQKEALFATKGPKGLKTIERKRPPRRPR